MTRREKKYHLRKKQTPFAIRVLSENIQKEIDRNEFILLTYQKERNELVGYTSERYANERLSDEMVISLTFKNAQLTEKMFPDQDDYYYLSDDNIVASTDYPIDFGFEWVGGDTHIVIVGDILVYPKVFSNDFFSVFIISCFKLIFEVLISHLV